MRQVRNTLLLISLFLLMPVYLCAQPWQNDFQALEWAKSKIADLTIEEKIGQLFMLDAYSNRGNEHQKLLDSLVRVNHIGGLIFFQGNPHKQVQLVNSLQEITKVPLFIAMDAEWGPSMRLDSCTTFPWAMTLGAVQDSTLLYQLGKEIALQCKAIGVNWNFAPVLDLNSNPNNPIINARSFGENANTVVNKALALSLGMQSEGVLSCGKHFPGHGDTDSDSHVTLPRISKSVDELYKYELKAFERAFKRPLASVMVGHLHVPSLTGDSTPTSLSEVLVSRVLRAQMKFNGLIVTDALNMAGVGKSDSGLTELNAFKAGNDVLLFPKNIHDGARRIRELVETDSLRMEQLNQSVLRILIAKYWAGLSKVEALKTSSLIEKLNSKESILLNKRLAESAITVLTKKSLPFSTQKGIKTAYIRIGKSKSDNFAKILRFYSDFDLFDFGEIEMVNLLYKLSVYDRVIVTYYTNGRNPWKSYKMETEEIQFLSILNQQQPFTFISFANPYSFLSLPESARAENMICAYQNSPDFEQKAAELIFGAIQAKGRLPVRTGLNLTAGSGIQMKGLKMLSFGQAEEVGMNSSSLSKIDEMVENAILNGSFPGAQVLVARKGKIVYDKSFGNPTYESNSIINEYHLYDLASITKIAASTLAIMHLYEKGKLDLDKPIKKYLHELKGSNKENLTLREIMAHQAGLQAWIPFYQRTLLNGRLNPRLYRKEFTEEFSIQIADSLFIRNDYADTIWATIVSSKLRSQHDYKYSDLGYYIMKRLIEKETEIAFDVYLEEHFYKPMGLTNLTFLPLNRFEKSRIVPTENDIYFRNQVIHGYVHDQGAAMIGGISGHAGLFSNAYDLAKLMQMYLNQGVYGDRKYLESSTLSEFTRCQYCETNNRRGVGFDKPQLAGDGPACECVSMLSYGHTGFTGTMAWVDPEQDLVYIFLSNRVFPDAQNPKLVQSGLRTKIQEVIYQSIVQP